MMSLNPLLAWNLGGPEILMILLIVLLLFGAKKLPELARGLGQSMREFNKAREDVEEEIKRASDAVPKLETPPGAQPRPAVPPGNTPSTPPSAATGGEESNPS